MAQEIFDYPSGDIYLPEAFELYPVDFVLLSEPSLGGPLKTAGMPGGYLQAQLTYAIQRLDERAVLAGWWAKAGVRSNRVRLHHLQLPAPRGTMRGSPLVKTGVGVGAESVVLRNMNGGLLRGDPIGLSDGLHLVTDDANPVGGEATVRFQPPVRAAVATDSAAVWDKPTAIFVATENPAPTYSARGGHQPFTVRLVEAPL